MQDFETRKIQTYEELKWQLETCYLTKHTTRYSLIDIGYTINIAICLGRQIKKTPAPVRQEIPSSKFKFP